MSRHIIPDGAHRRKSGHVPECAKNQCSARSRRRCIEEIRYLWIMDMNQL